MSSSVTVERMWIDEIACVRVCFTYDEDRISDDGRDCLSKTKIAITFSGIFENMGIPVSDISETTIPSISIEVMELWDSLEYTQDCLESVPSIFGTTQDGGKWLHFSRYVTQYFSMKLRQLKSVGISELTKVADFVHSIYPEYYASLDDIKSEILRDADTRMYMVSCNYCGMTMESPHKECLLCVAAISNNHVFVD